MKQNRFLHSILVLCMLVGVAVLSGCSEKEKNPTERWATVYEFQKLTDDNYIEKTKDGIVLLDFDAAWCGWCRKMDPHMARLADKMGDKIMIAKIDFDNNPKAVEEFGVQGIPALFVLVDGKLLRRAIGYQDEQQLFALLEDLVEDREKSMQSESVENEENSE